MKKTALLLGLHCHQPVDNFHEVLDEAIAKSYLPFFEIASEYPQFAFSVHYSGWLLEYIRDHAPELFALMQKLAKRGQVEFLTGGYYEPILASIPSADRRAQIGMLSDFIERHFSQRPRGLWLTERVWDGAIAPDLIACGVEYVVVDDYHFISSGFDAANLNGYFLTEEGGRTLKLFPINKHLRYQIPFSQVQEPIAYLESIADEPLRAGVIFDDGEKFGIWPRTHEWVYGKGWLRDFIEAVLASERIEAMRYDSYISRARPISLAYLPTTSYFEMGEWSLRAQDAMKLEAMRSALQERFGTEEIEKFVKGSIWKNFLVKYYESNHIHKRMLALSRSGADTPEYRESLYKAQCNDVLWHGVFGGIYLPNLRDNAYRFLIACENIAHPKKDATIVEDANCDGYEEIRCISRDLIAVFDSGAGGQLCELDSRSKGFNFANTLTRYEEAYHEKIREAAAHAPQKEQIREEEGISTIHNDEIDNPEQYLSYLTTDWYLKNCFVDHIVSHAMTLEELGACSFREYGDFANSPYRIVRSEHGKIKMAREGGIYEDADRYATTIAKRFRVKKSHIDFKITIGSEKEGFAYLMEHNFHFADLSQVTVDGKPYADGVISEATKLALYDPYTGHTLHFSLEQPADIYLVRLDTLSQSESGFELTNQGVTIGMKIPLERETVFAGRLEVI